MDELLFEVRGRVAILSFNRQKVLNACDGATSDLLESSLIKINQDPNIRCAILTGAGDRAFCSGIDIVAQSNFNVIDAYRMSRTGAHITDIMENMKIPIIAAINGIALGGGFEFALGCDMRIASENALIGLPEVNLGLYPGGGGTQRLPRLIGRAKALEMLYTGKKVSAQEALALGIVTKVVPQEKLIDEALAIADKIAAKPPLAIEYIKTVTRDGLECDLQRALQLESALFAHLYCSEDNKEAFRAFLEKRPPKEFTGH